MRRMNSGGRTWRGLAECVQSWAAELGGAARRARRGGAGLGVNSDAQVVLHDKAAGRAAYWSAGLCLLEVGHTTFDAHLPWGSRVLDRDLPAVQKRNLRPLHLEAKPFARR